MAEMKRKMTIDLAESRTNEKAKVFAGRTRGSSCRRAFNLDEIDKQEGVKVIVKVPDDTIAMTTSFILSFLGPSMVRAGSDSAFEEKFQFVCPEYIRPSIREGISRALKNPTENAVTTALSRGA